MAYLAAISAETGVPLFTRTKGDIAQLPFPVLGSLNGVHMFARNRDVKLLSTLSEDAKVTWHVYHDRIMLILIVGEEGSTDIHFRNLADYIFHGMVLIIGLDELIRPASVERLKRESRLTFSLVDTLLFGSDLLGSMTHAVDIVVSSETPLLEATLETFAVAADTQYACALVGGRMVAATDSWWQLSPYELVLLQLLVNHHPPSVSQDVPVYLPIASPQTPHRLLSVKIFEHFTVCLLCEEKPSMEDLLHELVPRVWRHANLLDSIRASIRSFPRGVAPGTVIDPAVLGFILVNTEVHRCLSSFVLGQTAEVLAGKPTISPAQRRVLLSSFYKSVVGPLFPHHAQPSGDETDLRNTIGHQPVETYLCAEEYKCYALHYTVYQFFVLFSVEIPTYSLRSLSYAALDTLTHDQII